MLRKADARCNPGRSLPRPSKENIAHTIDEYVSIEELFSVTQIYEWMMEAVLCETNKVS